MNEPILLLAIGLLFLAGLALDVFGRRIHVPRVTLLILLGAVIGPPALDIMPEALTETEDFYATVALTMVAFLLGGGLKRETLARHGRAILTISITVVLVSVLVVAGGLALAGFPLAPALLLGGIAAATAPAATVDVVRQSGAKGPFVTHLLGIVAVDDAWGVLAFSLLLTAAGALLGEAASGALAQGLWEIGGAVLLGLAVGLPAAALTGRLKPGEPTLIEALGLVFLLAGLALLLEVSFLLTGIVCGAAIVNLARHHEHPFHEIERIEWPFLLLFFVMAGASLDREAFGQVGLAGLLYVLLRFLARIAGGWLGGLLAGLPAEERRLTGLALMPQAGVAIGMALVASERLPGIGDQILAITIASTIVFELFGPLLTQFALTRAAAKPARPA